MFLLMILLKFIITYNIPVQSSIRDVFVLSVLGISSMNVKPAKRCSQQVMGEGKQTWCAWSRKTSGKGGQAQKGGKWIYWYYTKYTIKESMIADLQSEVTRAVMEVTPGSTGLTV
ncbi:GPI-anchored small secreted protein [Laccaria bicolor S238N-H82]|uniref:GPI-anchored small secreted protein n=1 Tax=Laccaria bicolor (strain S238N-H82 / ATCC MYA-4686) TaxID=486041 RepID=B0CNJ0_LACBS|nr:GPI-anchored small secreted protein [Laccaria bicolor S238N-H82]EDR15935.1 GPI-anchored small secreted protein [Laccaria bicolor S238N-H82]|eukprot:XP_001874143.1 GPI-anchored small secreted protein [Laccaria bicolor S238N-H82]